MTRKDYKALARALGVAWSLAERLDGAPGASGDGVLAVAYAVEQVSLALAADNPRFSEATFEAAVISGRDSENARHAQWLADRV